LAFSPTTGANREKGFASQSPQAQSREGSARRQLNSLANRALQIQGTRAALARIDGLAADAGARPMNARAKLPGPIEAEPLLCELCGGELDDLEALIHLRAAELVERWESADIRDNWRHTGEPRPKPAPIFPGRTRPYRTPQATVDAFWYVVSLCDPKPLKTWLGDHPQDAPFLLKLLEGK
jgi:hypothetical protein